MAEEHSQLLKVSNAYVHYPVYMCKTAVHGQRMELCDCALICVAKCTAPTCVPLSHIIPYWQLTKWVSMQPV
jgi:hypothetical protein